MTSLQLTRLIALGLAALGLSSCAAPTPQSRIAHHLAEFESLPPAVQAKVQQGKLAEGMTAEAVKLAWGRPDRVNRIERTGQLRERWTYTSLSPVFIHQLGIGYGSFGHGCRRSHFDDASWGPSIEYVPTVAQRVEFLNGRVVEWEVRNPR
jgi:hypothetical protein